MNPVPINRNVLFILYRYKLRGEYPYNQNIADQVNHQTKYIRIKQKQVGQNVPDLAVTLSISA